MPKSFRVLLVGLLLAGSSRAEESFEARLQKLEKRLEAGETAPPKAPSSGIGLDAFFENGLVIRSKDGAFEARIGGYVIAHAAIFDRVSGRDAPDRFFIKQAHVIVDAKIFKDFEVYVAPNLLPDGAALHDGWVEYTAFEWLKLRAGQYKLPYTLSAIEDERWEDFPEDSLVVPHYPGRDIGVMLHGTFFHGIINYAGGIFNGSLPGSNSDDNSDKDIVGRIGINPFAGLNIPWLRAFEIGAGGTIGKQKRATGEPPMDFKAPAAGDLRFAEPAPNKRGGPPPVVQVDDDRGRGAADISAAIGPVEVKSEVSYYRQRLTIDDARDIFRSFACYQSIALWITGERAIGKRPVVAHALFDGGFGALQIAARYSKDRIDDNFLRAAGYAGTNWVREIDGGISWYPNEHVRLSVEYANIHFGDRIAFPSGRLQDDENVWIFRAQVDF